MKQLQLPHLPQPLETIANRYWQPHEELRVVTQVPQLATSPALLFDDEAQMWFVRKAPGQSDQSGGTGVALIRQFGAGPTISQLPGMEAIRGSYNEDLTLLGFLHNAAGHRRMYDFTPEQEATLKQGDFSPLARKICQTIVNQGLTRVHLVGQSMGAGIAASVQRMANEQELFEVLSAVYVEPVNHTKRTMHEFDKAAAADGTHASPRQTGRFGATLMMHTNRVLRTCLTRDGFIHDTAYEPDHPSLIVGGADSHLFSREARQRNHDRWLRIGHQVLEIPGFKHDLINQDTLLAQLVKQVVKPEAVPLPLAA